MDKFMSGKLECLKEDYTTRILNKSKVSVILIYKTNYALCVNVENVNLYPKH